MVKDSDFAHLHVHTTYSELDGHTMISDLLDEVERIGQRGVAITDHGNMFGAVEFMRKTKARGLIPVIGLEAYMTPGGNHHSLQTPIFYSPSSGSANTSDNSTDDVSGKGAYTHMTLLAENTEGIYNLFKMSSLSFSEGMYRKPRISIDMLNDYGRGIIATTGCPSGDVQTYLRLGHYDKAVEYAARMQDILGKENYFVELMDHGMKSNLERGVKTELIQIAKELNIPIIATNDLHYAKQSDAPDHEVMLSMQTDTPMSVPPFSEGGSRFAFEGNSYYAKSAQEMAHIFGDIPGALFNTVEIMERAEGADIPTRDDLRPHVDVPEGKTLAEHFREQVVIGLEQRKAETSRDTLSPEYMDRLDKELDVILSKNYADYFLTVQDFVMWSKNNGVVVGPGRGSVGGCLAAYALKISELDPIKYDLIFERFLNPERDSPPDIDLDFDDLNRGRVVSYITLRHGEDKVSLIVTYGTLKAKQAFKDVAKAFSYPFIAAEKITKVFPGDFRGKGMSLKDAYNPNHDRYHEAAEFREAIERAGMQKVVEHAKNIEGRVRQTSIHAAGVIISSTPLVDAVPMATRKTDGATYTQFDYPTDESLGLLKVDVLGLNNLSTINNALRNIKDRRGIEIEMYDLVNDEMTDGPTFDLLRQGNTLGVFQLDSPGMRALLKRMKPTSFEDISAISALYRPGPKDANAHNDYADRKNGVKPVVPIHPDLKEALEPILGVTYGLVVYQEQVMRIAQDLAGYTLAQADMLRRAMGKKKKEVLDAEFANFQQGMLDNGFSKESVQALWDILLPFSDYAFNRSHSIAYAMVTYITAYLKANYPSEYMAALLTEAAGDPDKIAIYLHECRDMGIKVLPPDIQRSQPVYTPVGDTEVLVGIQTIRGIGSKVAESLVQKRHDTPGGFPSLSSYLENAPTEALGKRALEGLILSGAFDSYGYTRRTLELNLPDAARNVSQLNKNKAKGQDSFFDLFDDGGEPLATMEVSFHDVEEYPKKLKLSKEREMLGLYVSDHPLSGMENALRAHSTHPIIEINQGKVNVPESSGRWGDKKETVKIAGMLTGINKRFTQRGEEFAILEIEDLTGTIEATLFASRYKNYQHILFTDDIYAFTGTLRRRDPNDPIQFNVESMVPLKAREDGRIPFYIRITENQNVIELKRLAHRSMLKHKGDSPVIIEVKKDDGSIETIYVPDTILVEGSPTFSAEIRHIFGINSIGRWVK